MRTYEELITLPTFEERYKYLQIKARVGAPTFGSARYSNQQFYRSYAWKRLRNYIIMRDQGCDLAIQDRVIGGNILIHHIEPITEQDILEYNPKVVDPNNLISVSFNTHQAIHYGDETLLVPSAPVTRRPNDQSPWLQ